MGIVYEEYNHLWCNSLDRRLVLLGSGRSKLLFNEKEESAISAFWVVSWGGIGGRIQFSTMTLCEALEETQRELTEKYP